MYQGKQSWIKKIGTKWRNEEKIGQEQKTDNCFCNFLAPITEVLILEQLLGAGP